MQLSRVIVKAVATFFYIGYLPLFPGTFGSLLGIGIFYLVKNSPVLHTFLVLLLIILGFLFGGKAEKVIGRKDPPCIIIDEVCGMLLGLAFLPYDPRLVIFAFIVFRIFDSLKPYPVGLLQRFRGGLGIMGDDLIAAVYTNIVLQIVLRLASFKTS